MVPKHFKLREVSAYDDTGMIATAAVMDCGLCGAVISGMGGPGNGVVCEPCGELLLQGALKGAVTWAKDGEG